MTIALLFWILFLVGFIFVGVQNRDCLRGWVTDDWILWALLFLLGIGTFGSPIK